MKRDTIEFDLNNLPDCREIDLENGTFDLTLQKNDTSGVLSIDLESVDNPDHKIMGEPLTYGVPLWYWCHENWLPPERLVPLDESGQSSTCSIANLQDSVFLADDDSVYEDGDGDES
ncbi:phage baseplate plug family protein [Levilactobacillus spicheri]|uniref:Cyanophage baseplate Pam3 plug gp18 domain-containing protein n=2 Tax=Levilactobacillus spicheri TaxID=216463 RepID=A0ABQ0WQI5_9LACO|nr:hypothetical protein [Levilactobacillus spicheri]KRL50425.1 hypothetical protein FD37_GL002091 [Levilactobacillus spicheri DSM 15429]GEO67301.1 hypothetical protein LSP04_17200 [Levilactobacillus spicheri]